MSAQAPEETDILCENCGYMLNGLPPDGNCPECGTTIDLSVSERLRQPTAWESIGDSRPGWIRFLATTAGIIFWPRWFYRHSTSRGPVSSAYRFAQIHWLISGILLGFAGWIHWQSEIRLQNLHPPHWSHWVLLFAFPALACGALVLTIALAARLTTWEAAYRGFRLPHPVVLRALYFHSAHLLPVALVALATCAGYRLLFHPGFGGASEMKYLYILCAEVVLAAGYLFNTYWIGMRGWMYANR